VSGSSPTAGVTDVRGPVPGTPALQFAPYDLGALGYLEEEFFVSGRAEAFASENPEVAGAQVSAVDGADYLTRLVVRRPIDPARFNGSVIVEWLNVSGGIDVEPDWALSHRHIIREGFAWVGASVQKAGIDGGGLMEGENHLKALFPERYQTLVHPGDSYSFDMYSQIGRLLRGGDGPLAPLVPVRLIGAGHSQSAAFLVRYINDIDPLAGVFDGFYVHGRGATGARLDGWRIPPRDGAGGEQSGDLMNGVPTPIRADVRVPVLTLQSETDVVLLGGGRARQPDNDSFRLWEITGSAHAETYLLVASREDTGRESPAELATLLNATEGVSALFPTKVPIASGPQQHYVSHAALAHLDRWIAGGEPPPHGERLETGDAADTLVPDEHGIARGGIRTPWVDVPVATLSGLGGAGAGQMNFLFGTTVPFDQATLAELYPGGRADYLQRFEESLDSAIERGFLLEADKPEILAVVEAGYPG